ncbi:sigma-54 dependent transcriptional regulator [Desulfobacula sp.]|uniref:sigma-54-dependent transcriptional regulator n=1 Tax=Desulfobacula sp. TaxID=2593537 RepID=UPI00262EB2BB|nr:sigma-54 dependent transcriptional regulator [Desulfobacula sp.]
MSKILIIDDDHQVCRTLGKIFTRMDHMVELSLTLKEGIDKVSTDDFDIVFLDVKLPDGNGLNAIKHIRGCSTAPEVIIMTGEGSSDGAELAMRSKAWDYIQKGGSHTEFKLSLARALEYREQKLSKIQNMPINKGAIIGQCRQILNCFDQVSSAACNDLPVLITGETGTGKELFSRAIHNNSKQSQSDFVVLDCTSLPEYLVESTLFGHIKGAFTGADSDKIGLIKMADKGTLFLDEVGELPMGMQKKFLRALQEKRFRPVGSKKEINSDFRLISATHCDLTEMVDKNQFREDLFFRLFSINIHLPPLRDREKDIQSIALSRMEQKSDLAEKNTCTMSQDFLEEIQMYEWPGNVRELINTIDLVCSKAGYGSKLFPHHLPEHIRASNIKKKFKTLKNKHTQPPDPFAKEKMHQSKLPFKDHLEKTKSAYLQDLLSGTKGNIKESCKISGLSRSQLYRLMQQYDLKGI